MNASYFLLGIIVSMFLNGSVREFTRWNQLLNHKKVLRLGLQFGWPIVSGCALYPFFIVKHVEDHFINKWWQLIYSFLIVTIIVGGWVGIPALLHKAHAGIQEDWIRDVKDDEKLDTLIELTSNVKDRGATVIEIPLCEDEEDEIEDKINVEPEIKVEKCPVEEVPEFDIESRPQE